MTVKAATIEPAKLDWIKIYVNSKHYTESQAGKILEETGGDFCIGGPIFLWDNTTKNPKLPKGPCCHLKSDGKILCAPDYTVPDGFPGWNTPADYGIVKLPSDKANYLQCVPLIRNGKSITPLKVNADMAYACPRMAIGGKQGRVAYDVTTDKLTPTQFQKIGVDSGWDWMELLDGGGSTCIIFKDGGAIRCDPGRALYSYIVFKYVQTAPAPTPNDLKRAKVLSTAAAEIGVVESPAGSNRTKYGKWYGLDGYAWCMMWTQWVFAMAGLPLPLKTASCTEFANYAKAHGQWVTKDYKPGDILLMHWGTNAKATEHVGLAESVNSTYVVTIEGNTSLTSQDNGGKVMRRNRAYANITGAYRPWYNM